MIPTKNPVSKSVSIEDCDITGLEIKKKTVFFIGISDKAISVTENGSLRCIEFSNDLFKVLKKSIALPRSGDRYLPETICFVNAATGLDNEITRITNLGISVGDYKDLGVKAKRVVESGNSGPTGLQPQPNRGCFVCHNEIESKPSQCSACKAVIYCGAACAKKDWPTHKQMCSDFKKGVERVKEWDLHDFPFDYYNKEKILCNYNTVPLLNSQGKHNLGVFSRLCGCYSDIPWGELGRELLEKCQESGEPEKMFQLLGYIKVNKVSTKKTSRCRNPSISSLLKLILGKNTTRLVVYRLTTLPLLYLKCP